MLTTNAVLDLALSKQHDTSAALREKALAWLNEAICQLAQERDWTCMQATASLTIASNTILKPADYLRLRYVKNSDTANLFFFAERHRLTDEEAFEQGSDGTTPAGFTETAANIIFHPGATGTIELGYIRTIPNYADNVTTILDGKFKNLLARSVLSMIYEYEENSRALPSLQFDMVELTRLKIEENHSHPVTKRSKYLRGRL